MESIYLKTKKEFESLFNLENEKIKNRILQIIDQTKYKLYVMTPSCISTIIKSYKINFDDKNLKKTLLFFYLGVKTIDDKFDSDSAYGDKIIGLLSENGKENFELNPHDSDPIFLIKCLYNSLDKQSVSTFAFLNKIKTLNESGKGESSSSNISDYITYRKLVGEFTGLCTYYLTEPYLIGNKIQKRGLREFFVIGGKAGIFFDNYLDLEEDIENRIFQFELSKRDISHLFSSSIKEWAYFAIHYPNIAKILLKEYSEKDGLQILIKKIFNG